jgi:uncharacterized membrane protein
MESHLAASFWELPWHPALVHFPIAFLFTAGVAVLLHHLLGRASLDRLAGSLIPLGVATFPLVVLTGLRDAGWGDFFRTLDMSQPLPWHVLAGVVTIVVSTGWWTARRMFADTLTVRADCCFAGATVWLLVLTGLLAGEVVFA